MAQFNRIDQFVLRLLTGGHNFESDQLACYLTNASPVDANNVADLSPCVGHANIADKNIATTSVTQDSGIGVVTVEDKTMVASGDVGPFQYVYIYKAADGNLVCYYDFLSGQSLVDGQNFIVDFSDANNYLLGVTSP